jgi:hypothetical protein
LITLTGELLAVVDQTMQPTRASLWLRPQGAATATDGTAAAPSSQQAVKRNDQGAPAVVQERADHAADLRFWRPWQDSNLHLTN